MAFRSPAEGLTGPWVGVGGRSSPIKPTDSGDKDRSAEIDGGCSVLPVMRPSKSPRTSISAGTESGIPAPGELSSSPLLSSSYSYESSSSYSSIQAAPNEQSIEEQSGKPST